MASPEVALSPITVSLDLSRNEIGQWKDIDLSATRQSPPLPGLKSLFVPSVGESVDSIAFRRDYVHSESSVLPATNGAVRMLESLFPHFSLKLIHAAFCRHFNDTISIVCDPWLRHHLMISIDTRRDPTDKGHSFR